MNSNPSNEENDTFSEPLTKVELADLGQRPMQNRILHCQSSIAYQIYPFFFLLKQGQIINPPRQKHRLNHQIQTRKSTSPRNADSTRSSSKNKNLPKTHKNKRRRQKAYWV